LGSIRIEPARRLVRAEEGPPWPVRRVHAAAHGGARPGRAHPRREEQPDAGDLTVAGARRRGSAASAPAGDPFDALGDPNRGAIVGLLAGGGADGRSVGELADRLPISRPAVSRHLRLLKRAGLVVEEPRGTRRIYRLHDAGPDAVREYLERVWGDAAARFRLVADNLPARPADPRR